VSVFSARRVSAPSYAKHFSTDLPPALSARPNSALVHLCDLMRCSTALCVRPPLFTCISPVTGPRAIGILHVRVAFYLYLCAPVCGFVGPRSSRRTLRRRASLSSQRSGVAGPSAQPGSRTETNGPPTSNQARVSPTASPGPLRRCPTLPSACCHRSTSRAVSATWKGLRRVEDRPLGPVLLCSGRLAPTVPARPALGISIRHADVATPTPPRCLPNSRPVEVLAIDDLGDVWELVHRRRD